MAPVLQRETYFDVTLPHQGPHPQQRQRLCCKAPKHEELLTFSLAAHQDALAQRQVDPSSVVLRFRDQENQLFTIHDQLALDRAMEEARDSEGVVQLDFLLQVAPAARQQRKCRSCQQLFTSRNQLFLHLKVSGHGDDSQEDEEKPAASSLGNETFRRYYSEQGIAPETLWQSAYEVLKTPLPLVLRATGHPLAAECEQRLAEMTELCPLPLFSHTWMVPALNDEVKSYLAAGQEVGLWHRQEWASMLPVLALDLQPEDKVLDLCASPGSKTLQMLETQLSHGAGGLLVANDVSRPRALVVAQRSRRRPRETLLVTSCDGRDFPALKTWNNRKVKFQKVLVDAPCSGDGTLRKSCAGWVHWRAGEGKALHKLQLGLLRRGFECLEVGGTLVYSTCSLNPLENEAVVQALLADPSAELLCWDPLNSDCFQEGLTTWKVPDEHFEENGCWMSKPQGSDRKTQVTLFPSDPPLAVLKRCRRLLPATTEAHHGGFFVAKLRKTRKPPPERREGLEGTEDVKETHQPKQRQLVRSLFKVVPDERWEALEAYWAFSADFPKQLFRLNKLNQLILASRSLANCFLPMKVDLPILEAGLAIFPASSCRPFDEAVPFLARYTSRKRSLSLEQFLEMLRKVQCCGAVRGWEAKDSFMICIASIPSSTTMVVVGPPRSSAWMQTESLPGSPTLKTYWPRSSSMALENHEFQASQDFDLG
ncbi:unnamed protein product [Cladocopium goreaui]|uniref:RNA cytosine-C(5)-methyltransferase NSUN2 (NOL1/NOP2/Sun domain family member 2) (mRNA cytosine C(5)-methyltransferase) (tRNA cytosin e C(5)-methyltransferase) n=1 Tax=Cladocopium goreaui TaxID=2562237 RepID=A0A9P1DQ35_9DINO|nr:unnamed protein product [Cladocopium goreaui]